MLSREQRKSKAIHFSTRKSANAVNFRHVPKGKSNILSALEYIARYKPCQLVNSKFTKSLLQYFLQTFLIHSTNSAAGLLLFAAQQQDTTLSGTYACPTRQQKQPLPLISLRPTIRHTSPSPRYSLEKSDVTQMESVKLVIHQSGTLYRNLDHQSSCCINHNPSKE